MVIQSLVRLLYTLCLIGGLFLGGLFGGLLGSDAQAATIEFTPKNARFDEPVHITVHGLNPSQMYRISLRSREGKQGRWIAAAEFEASSTGSIDLEHSPALSGDYQGVDAMGLFWSLNWLGAEKHPLPQFELLDRLFLSVADKLK